MDERSIWEERLPEDGRNSRRMHEGQSLSGLWQQQIRCIISSLSREPWMKELTSAEEMLEFQDLRRADPERYLEIVNEWLRQNRAYFSMD